MATRVVTIQYDASEVVGDEEFELYMKIAAGAWALHSTGAMTDPTQEFELTGLEEGVEHRTQVRMVRSGRYRAEYSNPNPDLWPEQSLAIFTPGETDFAAPSINSAAWERTSGVAQSITVNATANPAHTALAIQLLRDGVVVDEVAGPHVGAIDLVDADPPIAATHAYTVRHRDGFLVGAQSAATNRWAGPDKPVNLVQPSAGTWYDYTIQWDAPPAGAVTRVADQYLCPAVWAERGVTASDAVTFTEPSLEKNSLLMPNGNAPASFLARARHEVTAFAVTDVSEWVQVSIDTEIASDETAFESCP